MPSITSTAAWQALASHHAAIRDIHMRDLFTADSERFRRFSLRFGDLLLDYSKNRITPETMDKLIDLARAADVEGWRERCSPARRSTPPRGAPCCTWRCATRDRADHGRRAQDVDARRHVPCSTRCASLHRRGARRRVDRRTPASRSPTW
jgi:hypothetical protein